jgi:cytochrome b561
MFATLCLGIFCTWARGDSIFGLFRIPAFDPGNRELRHDAVEWHELAANTLLAVAALHALAALWHQFVRRDGLIDRMRFAPRPPRD